MPTVFRHKGYRFFFYSNEGDPLEPLHIHVIKGECVAKFWLDPEVAVAESYGMKSSELTMLSKVVKERSDLIRKVWNEYFD
jgi:hypothetical protein